MVTDDIARRYNTLSAEDRRTFDRWLKANAAVGLIIAGGLVAMALAASNSAGPRDAMLANSQNVSDLVAPEKRQERSGMWARQKVEVHEKKF